MKQNLSKKDIHFCLKLASEIARQAGDNLKRYKLSKRKISIARHDIKLQADRFTEKKIINELSKKSAIPILSEESGLHGIEKLSSDHPVWIVDPIDGTVNYYREIPNSTVSIALWDSGYPLFGVVYDFNREELYTGGVGVPSKLNGKRIQVSQVSNPKEGILATGIPAATHFSKKVISNWVQKFQSFQKVRLLGCASLSLCYVASGKVDAYEENHIKLWDVAAGLPIVLGAGGKISYRDSKNASYSMIVRAWNGKIWKN